MFKQKNTRIILLCVILALIIGIVGFFIIKDQFANSQVKDKITKEQAQDIIDQVFTTLPVNVADSAKLIIDKTDIKVQSVEYGYEKDVILTCTYSTINTKAAILPNLDSIATRAYEITQKNGSNQVGIRLKAVYAEMIETAEPVSGNITLYIYETTNGMQLYLTNDIIRKA